MPQRVRSGPANVRRACENGIARGLRLHAGGDLHGHARGGRIPGGRDDLGFENSRQPVGRHFVFVGELVVLSKTGSVVSSAAAVKAASNSSWASETCATRRKLRNSFVSVSVFCARLPAAIGPATTRDAGTERSRTRIVRTLSPVDIVVSMPSEARKVAGLNHFRRSGSASFVRCATRS